MSLDFNSTTTAAAIKSKIIEQPNTIIGVFIGFFLTFDITPHITPAIIPAKLNKNNKSSKLYSLPNVIFTTYYHISASIVNRLLN